MTDASARRSPGRGIRLLLSAPDGEASPLRVDGLTEAAVVDVAHHGVEGREVEALTFAVEEGRRIRVRPGLRDVAGARDDRRHTGERGDPGQRRGGEGDALRKRGGEFGRGIQPHLVVDAREGLATVERLSVTVVVAVVVR